MAGAVHGVEEGEVGAAGEVGVRRRVLDDRAHVGQHVAGRPGHPAPEQVDGAGGGQHQAEQHPHRGGLAGAVGAEEAVDVALADVEVDAVDGGDPPVALGQAGGPDQSPASEHGVVAGDGAGQQVRGRPVEHVAGDGAADQPAAVAAAAAEQHAERPDRDGRPVGEVDGARGAPDLLAQRVRLAVADRDGEHLRQPLAVHPDGAAGVDGAVQPRDRVRRQERGELVGGVGDVDHVVEGPLDGVGAAEGHLVAGRLVCGEVDEGGGEVRGRRPLAPKTSARSVSPVSGSTHRSTWLMLERPGAALDPQAGRGDARHPARRQPGHRRRARRRRAAGGPPPGGSRSEVRGSRICGS